MDNKNPLFSIITVSLNSSKTIERTILSVLNQTCKNYEYIIVDGESTDGTKEIVEKYKKIFPIIYLSEKDEGIYNAMNKGLDLTKGQYLNFMNSDDYFFNNNVLDEVTPFLDIKYDIIYGNAEIRYKDFKFLKKEPRPEYLWMGPVNHQSSFIKRETMQKYRFNIGNKLVADYELFLNVYYKDGKILKINKTIASFSNDGVSQKNDRQVIIDCYKTLKKFKNNLFIKIYYKILMVKPVLKKILPISIFKFIRTKIFN
jgi:glycosyltransferase involved in cell wall biosynthesis